jgi:broad specificity phosphatase PhoE
MNFDHLSSPLLRAVHTAAIIERCQTEHKVDVRFNERDYGRWILGAATERPAEAAGDSEVDVLDGDGTKRGMVRYLLVTCVGRWRAPDGRSRLSTCRKCLHSADRL